MFLDLGGRIAKLLVQRAERQSDDPSLRLAVDLHLTQTELAQMVGASRPAVNRVLQGLVGRGVIRVDGRTSRSWMRPRSVAEPGCEPHARRRREDQSVRLTR